MAIYNNSESVLLETERLSLRVLEAADLKDLQDIWGDSEVMKYCGGALSGIHRLTRSIQYYETIEVTSGISAYAVILKETSEMVGVCGFNSTGSEGVYELVYHFKRNQWGNGYATEACRAAIQMIRETKCKHCVCKLIASLAPENSNSKRVLEKCGFVYVGDHWFEDTKRFEPRYELVISEH